VSKGFAYTSENNEEWMLNEEIADWIKQDEK